MAALPDHPLRVLVLRSRELQASASRRAPQPGLRAHVPSCSGGTGLLAGCTCDLAQARQLQGHLWPLPPGPGRARLSMQQLFPAWVAEHLQHLHGRGLPCADHVGAVHLSKRACSQQGRAGRVCSSEASRCAHAAPAEQAAPVCSGAKHAHLARCAPPSQCRAPGRQQPQEACPAAAACLHGRGMQRMWRYRLWSSWGQVGVPCNAPASAGVLHPWPRQQRGLRPHLRGWGARATKRPSPRTTERWPAGPATWPAKALGARAQRGCRCRPALHS